MIVEEVKVETNERKIRQRLEAVKRQITLHPEQYDQREWGHCGTACCIAGWLMRNEGLPLNGGPVSELAAKLIGLEGPPWLFTASLSGGPPRVADAASRDRWEISPAIGCMAIDAWMEQQGI